MDERDINLKLTNRKKFWKKSFSHIGLFLFLSTYCCVGGFIFRALERPAALERSDYLRRLSTRNRNHLIWMLTNNTDVRNLEYLVSVELANYEKTLQKLAENGQRLSYEQHFPLSEQWSRLQAVFFASSVLTTIGYGHIVPVTINGRIFCIFFAIIGIPLTVIVIGDCGKLIATMLSKVVWHIPEKKRYYFSKLFSAKWSSALAAICLFVLYLSFGAGIMLLWEKKWTFFDGFYFCFITMTTIGFGDLIPGDPKYMLLCTAYILIGLALTSTIIELVRREYAHSWQQLQILRGTISAALRKMGENSSVNLDYAAMQKVLMISMPRWSPNIASYKKQQEQMAALEVITQAILEEVQEANELNAKRKVLQIVIYESSV